MTKSRAALGFGQTGSLCLHLSGVKFDAKRKRKYNLQALLLYLKKSLKDALKDLCLGCTSALTALPSDWAAKPKLQTLLIFFSQKATITRLP